MRGDHQETCDVGTMPGGSAEVGKAERAERKHLPYVCTHTCSTSNIPLKQRNVLVSVATRPTGASARETYWRGERHLPVKGPDELGDNYAAFCRHH